eukprot:8921125-Karenia_brevis.AAC.1
MMMMSSPLFPFSTYVAGYKVHATLVGLRTFGREALHSGLVIRKATQRCYKPRLAGQSAGLTG